LNANIIDVFPECGAGSTLGYYTVRRHRSATLLRKPHAALIVFDVVIRDVLAVSTIVGIVTADAILTQTATRAGDDRSRVNEPRSEGARARR